MYITIKLGYLVRMDHDSMDSNPIRATSRWNSLAKTYRIVINHIFMIKNMSDINKNKPPHIFTPPRPLGRKHHDIQVCRPSNCGKIVISSLNEYLKINKPPHIFTPPLPNGRRGVKIWVGLFLLISDIFFIMKIRFITILQVFLMNPTVKQR